MVGNGRSAEQLSAAHPFDLLRTAPNCDNIACVELEILFLLFAVGIEIAICVNAQTVVVIVLT
jgi:hypothetical protein